MRDLIIGHSKILDFFDKVMVAGNLSHAYCFVGPKGVGKKTLAQALGASMLGVDKLRLGQQPDFLALAQEKNLKTDKTKKNIDVEQIRKLRDFLSQKSFLGGYKVAIIEEANKLNNNSANVLLKTLEEPKGKSIIFLLATDEYMLPETIRSRCQMVYFHLVPKGLIERFLLTRGVDKSLASEMARLSGGLPGRVISWLANSDEYEAYKKEIIRFIRLFHRPFFEKLNQVDDLFLPHRQLTAGVADHIAAREKLLGILDIWLGVLRGFIHSNYNLLESKLKVNLSDAMVLNITGQIQEIKDAMSKNIHPRLLIERVLLEMP